MAQPPFFSSGPRAVQGEKKGLGHARLSAIIKDVKGALLSFFEVAVLPPD